MVGSLIYEVYVKRPFVLHDVVVTRTKGAKMSVQDIRSNVDHKRSPHTEVNRTDRLDLGGQSSAD